MLRTRTQVGRDVARLGGVAQIDEDRRLARRGDAAGVVERLQLLELLLDPVGDLLGGLLGRGAGPLRLDHHRLDGEGRIFLAAEIEIGEQPGRP